MASTQISVIGGGRCDGAAYELALEVGRLLAEAGATVVCGGLSGVMEAAARGAKQAGGATIGILPGQDRFQANSHIDYAVATGIGHGRNLAVVASADAVIAIGGAYGTLSEIGLAGVLERPVVIVGGWHLRNEAPSLCADNPIRRASSAAEAVDWALEAAAAWKSAHTHSSS